MELKRFSRREVILALTAMRNFESWLQKFNICMVGLAPSLLPYQRKDYKENVLNNKFQAV